VTWQKLIVIALFLAVVYNLGAAAYYLKNDQGKTGRTVRSLTWRIGLSVLLIVLVAVALKTGMIESHGIRVGH
jgi:uncharacterized membrane protein